VVDSVAADEATACDDPKGGGATFDTEFVMPSKDGGTIGHHRRFTTDGTEGRRRDGACAVGARRQLEFERGACGPPISAAATQSPTNFEPYLTHSSPRGIYIDNRWQRLSMGEAMGRVPDGLLPGTLDLLILQVLAAGTLHGYAIAQRLKVVSRDVLDVGESSLYPALQRLLLNGDADAEWGVTDSNRRARYYTISRAGRKRLAAERDSYERMDAAIRRVLAM
jgi:PadR family transcriptional regulator PadR